MSDPDRDGPSGKQVSSFSDYCEGDRDPRLNKRIRELIKRGEHYIVYLDDELCVQWSGEACLNQSPAADGIRSQVMYWEAVVLRLIAPEYRQPYARLLGEVVASTLPEGNVVEAKRLLPHVKERVLSHARQRARTWLLSAALITGVPVLLVLGAFWWYRFEVRATVGLPGFETLFASLAGGVGAVLSLLARSSRLKVDFDAGSGLHYLEGTARVFAGVIAGSLVSLAAQAGMLLAIPGSPGDQRRFASVLVLGAIAGFSERLVKAFATGMEVSLSPAAQQTVGADEGRTG